MNKKITIAVAAAAAVSFVGTAAFASDITTINSSEAYKDAAYAKEFVPAATTTADCEGSTAGNASDSAAIGNCSGHGDHLVMTAAGLHTVGYFSAIEVIPDPWLLQGGSTMNQVEGAAFYQDALAAPGFSNAKGEMGIFAGLVDAWTNITDAQNMPDRPMGVPGGILRMMMHDTHREEWIDQTVVGYVTMAATSGGDSRFAQNFRSQLSWNGTVTETAGAVIDQRLEQSVELGLPGSNDAANTANTIFEASRQTLQVAMHITGAAGTGQPGIDPDVNPGTEDGFAQLVSQDIEGYFKSCLNCDSAEITGALSHGWDPEGSVHFIPYKALEWNLVPTVEHARTDQF